jgi:CubicO group peptidase (beta-lactamase class C family)
MPIDAKELEDKLAELATKLEVPGVSVGVYLDGEEIYAYHGVTSVENPLPVDEKTFFQFGSTGKTFTATAVMRLVDQGQIDLDAPVRKYVPELKLRDEDVADRVTVLQLFNHTAGWDGDMFDDTGDGDDAIEKFVARMERLQQVTPLGSAVSYNNAALVLAGRVIEKVTGKPYAQAIRELLLEPLGLTNTLMTPNEIMSRRFAVGHNKSAESGEITVARPWALPTSARPAGGISANAKDQIAWARFHLGDGKAPDGTQILSSELLDRMKQPTAEMPGSAIGDYVGISWLLRDVGGVRLVGHGGSTNGQYSSFEMCPERNFAIAILTNCGPNGPELMRLLEKWALERYIGVIDSEPEQVQLAEDALAAYTGTFETIAALLEVKVEDGRLQAQTSPKPEMVAMLNEVAPDELPEQPPIPLGIVAGPGDRYVVIDGPAKGMKGYFRRDADGKVDAVHMGGRLATRVSAGA